MRRLLLVAIVGSRVAIAGPAFDHVVAAPTAWMPAENAGTGTAGLDRYGNAMIDLGYGLGGISEVDIGVDTDVRACAACSHDNPAPSIYLARAGFRLGAPADAWFAGQPALVFGVRVTAAIGERRVGDAYIVASERIGFAAVHAGVEAIDAGDATMRMGTHVRPFVGAQLTPPKIPKTTVIGDLVWLPRFETTAPTLEYMFSWGVRYQALTWGSIELVVQQRQRELDIPSVLVRVTGVWGSVTLPR
jgi:hypothetical protein